MAETMIDPVCGMTVDGERASTATYRGRKYFFCCLNCKRRFEQDPLRYARSRE